MDVEIAIRLTGAPSSAQTPTAQDVTVGLTSRECSLMPVSAPRLVDRLILLRVK